MIDAWSTPGWQTSQPLSTTSPNERRPIRIELFDTNGAADTVLTLNWISPGQSEVLVPEANLFPNYELATSASSEDASLPAGESASSSEFTEPYTGQPDSVTQGSGADALTTSATYEDDTTGGYGRQRTRTLPAGNTWTYEYYGDAETLSSPPCGLSSSVPQAGFLKTRIGPDPDGAVGIEASRIEEFAYDEAGRQAASRIGDDEWSCTTFDPRGRPLTQSYPASADGQEPARTITLDHLVAGNPLVSSASDPAGTITTTVDLLGRPVSYTDVWGQTTLTTYNQAGAVTQTSGPAGVQQWVYDSVTGRLTQQKLDSAVIAELYYNAAGELTSVEYPSEAGQAGNGTKLSVARDDEHDPTGGTTGLHWDKIAGGMIARDDVKRSQSGRVIDQWVDDTDAHAGDNFVYDNAGRLTAAWVPGREVSYGFDASGGCGTSAAAGKNTNRTAMTIDGGAETTYCYDLADRIASTNDARYATIEYDAHGNTVTLGDEELTYDGADRHIETVKGSTTVGYVRDATDRIVERKVNDVTFARYGFTGDGDSAGFTLTVTNQVIERTIGLPGGAMVTKRSSGDIWSYPNVHGDLIATSNASGEKQGQTLSFDAFGEALGTTPDNSVGNLDYGWLGQHQRPVETEAGIATVEMGARAYVPGLGRFLSVDPIEGGSANDYEYGLQDPTNTTDLDGQGVLGLVALGLLGACAFYGYRCVKGASRLHERVRSMARSINSKGQVVSSGAFARRVRATKPWGETLRACGKFAELIFRVIVRARTRY